MKPTSWDASQIFQLLGLDFRLEHVNVSRKFASPEEIEDARDELKERNRLDLQLHEHAAATRQARLHASTDPE